jgi:hypothetical protein
MDNVQKYNNCVNIPMLQTFTYILMCLHSVLVLRFSVTNNATISFVVLKYRAKVIKWSKMKQNLLKYGREDWSRGRHREKQVYNVSTSVNENIQM